MEPVIIYQYLNDKGVKLYTPSIELAIGRSKFYGTNSIFTIEIQ